MDTEMRVLIIEAAAGDANLYQQELHSAGIRFTAMCVETRAAVERALAEFAPSVVLCNYQLPGPFDGPAALKLAREKRPDTPFVFISGKIGEDVVAESMKRGATDFVLKDRLMRLAPVLTRALREARELAAHRGEARPEPHTARSRLILEHSPEAFVVTDQNDVVVEWSKQAETLFGWKSDEVKGRIFGNTVVPDDYRNSYEKNLRYLERFRESRIPFRQVELQVRRRNGTKFPAELTTTPIEFEGKRLFAVFVRDVTRQSQARQRLNVQYAVAQVLAETGDFEQVPLKLLQVTCENMGFTVGALWEVDRENKTLRCANIWHVSSPELEEFVATTRQMLSTTGSASVQRALHSGGPVWIPDATMNPTSPRVLQAAKAGLHENLAFPIAVRGEIIGIMDFFGPEGREPKPEFLEVFTSIGTQIGQFLERRRQQERIARLNRIYAVLSGINSLIARVRDRQALFEGACHIAAEHGKFGLAWIGKFHPETQEVIPVAWNGLGPVEAKTSRSTARSDDPLGQGLVGRAIRERRPAISNDISLEQSAGGKRRQEALRLGYRSIIVLPLYEGDAVAGTLALFAKEANFFTDDELKLLTELSGDISHALQSISQEEKLHYVAYYDALTGLPNRTLFHDRLTQAIHLARQRGGQMAVLFGDIRRFRLFNETFGRHVGDAVLREVANRIRQHWPAPDSVARIAVDCFAGIAMDVSNASEIAHLVGKVTTDISAKPFAFDNKDFAATFVAGIAVFPSDGPDADTLMRNAEAALRQAKASGEPHLFYQPAMNERVSEALILENRMRRALENDEFLLHYQPKLSLVDGVISGVEALIRWNDPDSGIVPPAKFISLLEETGMILGVGHWAMRKAMSEQRDWHAEAPAALRVAVNVSPMQLKQKDFVEVVRHTIEELGAPPQCLELEITESLVMDNVAANTEKLRAVRELGVSIAIDDFGTGYSSLSYLTRLPADTLKIDRAFITPMTTDPDCLSIVSTIIALAHAVKLKVVAEGVETEEQVRLLKQLKCDEIQGYIFSKPLPSPEMLELLRKQRKT